MPVFAGSLDDVLARHQEIGRCRAWGWGASTSAPGGPCADCGQRSAPLVFPDEVRRCWRCAFVEHLQGCSARPELDEVLPASLR